MYGDVIGDLKIYVSETKYPKYQQNIEGRFSSFRISKCQKKSKLARIFMDFLDVSVLSIILSFMMPHHCIGCICYYPDVFWDLKMHIFLRRSLAHINYIEYDFFFSVGRFGGLAPPPPTPNSIKLATLLRESPPPKPSLGVQYIILNNRNGFPTPCTEIIYIWRLFGARVHVNSNLIMHKKPVFSTQLFKKSPSEGIPIPHPPHWCPIHYT